jgi:hypothetical protein
VTAGIVNPNLGSTSAKKPRMTVTDEQVAAVVARFQQARLDAGLPRLVDDEGTLRLVAAVVASNERRTTAPVI